MALVAGRLPPLLPTPTSCISLTPPPASYAPRRFEGARKPAGRASSSGSWVKDKLGGGAVSSDRSQDKMPGRASRSSRWVADKLVVGAGTSASSVERAGRPTWRDGWNGGKRAASSAPSADRSEKKAKPPADEDDDALESETQQYAGPTFVLLPDPSELPIPFFFLKAR